MYKYWLLVMLLLHSGLSAQTTWVVSNSPGFPSTFNDLQAAIDDSRVAQGDILLVQGSPVNYGDIDVTKRVTIMGPGYFLNENKETQTNLQSAQINSIVFKQGSDGSILQGMDIRGNRPLAEPFYGFYACTIGQFTFGTFGINIEANRIVLISVQVSDNIVINKVKSFRVQQSYFSSIYNHPEAEGISIHNNIIVGGINIYNALFLNNSFVSGGAFYCKKSIVRNSIINTQYIQKFGGCRGWAFLPDSSDIEINLFPSTYPIDGSSNFNTTDFGFVGVGSTDGIYQLKPNSIAVGSGNSGNDLGHLSGLTPYKLSGISLHPNIFSVTMPQTATSGGGLKVEVKVRAND
jgi:hypothetical protein